jgi:hypothetical protein
MPMRIIDFPKKILRLFIGPFGSRTVSCKLFNDTVSDQLCRIRKRELHNRGFFSCRDCKEQ